MKIGDCVILNEHGTEAWKNNPEKQWVPYTTTWQVVAGAGFDHYGPMVKLIAFGGQTNNKSIDGYEDSYYVHCLQVVDRPDTKK